MIDWLAIAFALFIIVALIGIFGFAAWKINISDPIPTTNLTGKKDETSQLLDSTGDKRVVKVQNDRRKKRKDNKKSNHPTKEQVHEQHTVTFKEPVSGSDDDEEESDHESSPVAIQTLQLPSKPRKRNKNKASASSHIEGILVNKDEKSPITRVALDITHPIIAKKKPKDEVELAKEQGRIHPKSSHQQKEEHSPKQSSTSAKKSTPAAASVDQDVQQPKQREQQQQPKQHEQQQQPKQYEQQQQPKQREQQQQKQHEQQQKQQEQHQQKQHEQHQQKQHEQQEQPFTKVVSNRHKISTTAPQQQLPQNRTASASSFATTTMSPAVTVSNLVVHGATAIQNQQEPLPQRQPPRQQELQTQVNGLHTNIPPTKQQVVTPPMKIVDIIKTLPTSQTIVTELMLAFDAVNLSTDELDIIMHKIANKQAVIKKDWSKLQHGQKVDPQAHMGQVIDETARAFEEDIKTNAIKRIQELTDELNNDKRIINDLIKEKNDKDKNIQVLQAQLNAMQHLQQQIQKYEAEFQRLTDENMQFKRITQQQQQYSSINPMSNTTDKGNIQIHVLSEQTKKLSVDNANLEKQLNGKDLRLNELQKEKDDLIRKNQQFIQKLQETQKQYQLNEEKLLKELNENRTIHMNQLNEFKCRIEQIELDNEKFRQEKRNQIELIETLKLKNEERDKFEQELKHLKQKLVEDNEQNKKIINDIQIHQQTQENDQKQQIDQLNKTIEEYKNNTIQNNDLIATMNTLKSELTETKTTNDAMKLQFDVRIQQEQDKQKQILIELLEEDVRNQLPNDIKDFQEWLSTYRRIFSSSFESIKRALQDESITLKRENDQILHNMRDVENQLKQIEQTLQTKEERLLDDLKSKDTALSCIRSENEQLTSELDRLRIEINRLQSEQHAIIDENHALQVQLDEHNIISSKSSTTTITSTLNNDELTVSSTSEQQEQVQS